MAVPYTFGSATAAIPLSQLDSNFATTITLGNTAIQLGNTVTTLNNMTLANVTVSSGSVTLTNIAVTTANVTTANISGTTTLTNLTASTALALDASKNIASVTNTGTGNNVLATSPTITTPTISQLTSAAATALTLQSAGTTAVTVDTSQNVGIGTSSPKGKLTVLAPSSTTLGDEATSAINIIGNNGAGKFWQICFGAYDTSFTNAPAAIGYVQTTSSGFNNGALVFATRNVVTDTAPTERMRIASDGIVTMSAYGAGAATFSAAGVISSVSDETWKIKDGVPVDPDSMLNKLEPGYWYYNDERKETFGTDRQLGFYAQNVNAAIGPEAAPVPEEGKPWGYYDRSVLAVTVMSLQKALATIESLTARIAALEAK